MNVHKSTTAVRTGLAAVDSLHSRYRVSDQYQLFDTSPARKDGTLCRIYVVHIPEKSDPAAIAEEYAALPEIEFAEPDRRMELFGAPNDPLYSNQWYLHNTGQEYLGIDRYEGPNNDTLVIKTGVADADIDAQEAFDSQGETTRPLIGIIDTGIDTDHEDLADNIWVNPGEDLDGNGIIGIDEQNGLDDDHNGYVDDFYGWDFSGDSTAFPFDIEEDNVPTDDMGHGTHCAGIVGAVRDNALGVSGIAGPCRIAAIRIFPNAYFTVSARAIVYAADIGCDVINLSWGGPFYSGLLDDVVQYAWGRDVLVVGAAGNFGSDIELYPAALPNVLTVGASNSRDEVTYFSSYGEHMEVVAPGRDILSLRADQTDIYTDEPGLRIINDHYYLMDGTSMSAPCVVGVAAHLLAVSPGLSAQRLWEIIEQSADDILYPYGDSAEAYVGRDIYSGYGRVNLYSAVQMLSGCLANIVYPYEHVLLLGDTVTVTGSASGAAFTDYRLEYGVGNDPAAWTEIISSTTPVNNDVLGKWAISGLNGAYTLRLTVGAENQAIVHVIVGNTPAVEITSPSAYDTIDGLVDVIGNTVVEDFTEYTLIFGYGAPAAFWDTITTSSRMIADDVLGTVAFGGPHDDELGCIKLTVHTTGGETYADSVPVYLTGIVSDGWVRPLTGLGSMAPATGDLDGDGFDEIITGVGYSSNPDNLGGVEVYSAKGNRLPGWPRDIERSMGSLIAVADLDGDGIDDLVACSRTEHASDVRAYLSRDEGWNSLAGSIWNDFWIAPPAIADLENDGELEILVVGKTGVVKALRHDGSMVFTTDVGRDGGYAFGFPGVAVADINADGTNEVIVCIADAPADSGGVFLLDTAGTVFARSSGIHGTFSFISGFSIADIDDSGDLEIIIAGGYEDYLCVAAMNYDMTQAPGFPIILDDVVTWDWFGNQPAVVDLDGDGILEIVVTVWSVSEGRVYAWHEDGTPVGQIKSTSTEPFFARVSGSIGPPILADINDDGNLEILGRAGALLSVDYERLFAWDCNGNLVSGFPLYVAGPSAFIERAYAPLVADPDGDGRCDILLNTEAAGSQRLNRFELESGFTADPLSWPSPLHDSWNSRLAGFQPSASSQNAAPYDLHIEIGGADRVTLGWMTKAPRLSAGYNLYRSPDSGQPGIVLNTALIPRTDSHFVDTTPAFGETYYYTITNIDTAFIESAQSPEVCHTVGLPSSPKSVQYHLDGTDAMMIWRMNPAAEIVTGYNIYARRPGRVDFGLLDSTSGDTSFVDDSPKPAGFNEYYLTAVNGYGESRPSDDIILYISGNSPDAPFLELQSYLDTNVVLTWSADFTGACNIYRSTVSGHYPVQPLNSEPIVYEAGITYRDTGLTAGSTYFYVVTAIANNIEGPFSNEVAFTGGQINAPFLDVISRRDAITVTMSMSDTTIPVSGFRIYRRVFDNAFEIIDSLVPDTVYSDDSISPGIDYRYAASAISARGIESALSEEDNGCMMAFDQGLAAISVSTFWDDSTSEFYQRILADYESVYYHRPNAPELTLLDFSRHPVALIYEEDPIHRSLFNELGSRFEVLSEYLDAGGKLVVAGRDILSGPFAGDTVYDFSEGDFEHDYLGVDSAFLSPDRDYPGDYIGMVGAQAAVAGDYPTVIEVDSAKAARYLSLVFPSCQYGQLVHIDYAFPFDNADILYTYIARQDTASSHGQPVAFRRSTETYSAIWILFPLFFMEESEASQLLHAALADFGIVTSADDFPETATLPRSYSLSQNYPNPFNPITTVQYELPRASHVVLEIFNILGQRVLILEDDYKPAGQYSIPWNGTDETGRPVATGIYLYRLRTAEFTATRKMLLMK